MGELGALFNPGMRHELEERQAKAARREEEGNARDGDLRIDLDSGIAVINVDNEDGDEPADPAESSAADVSDDVARPVGRHAVTDDSADSETARPGSRSADDQDANRDDAAPTEQNPPVLRPRGKRGLSTGRAANPEPARSSSR